MGCHDDPIWYRRCPVCGRERRETDMLMSADWRVTCPECAYQPDTDDSYDDEDEGRT